MVFDPPPILKEWQDIILEYGFAYGHGGDKLKGKLWLTAVTAGAPESAYGPGGHNKIDLRSFLAPLEATANLCQMPYIAPYALFASLNTADTESRNAHVSGFGRLLESLRDDTFNVSAAQEPKLIGQSDLSKFIIGGAS